MNSSLSNKKTSSCKWPMIAVSFRHSYTTYMTSGDADSDF